MAIIKSLVNRLTDGHTVVHRKSNLLSQILPVYSKELFIEVLVSRDKDKSRGTDSNIQTRELDQE